MKIKSKLFSLALAGIMLLGCATTVSAAEPVSEDVNNESYVVEQQIPVVFEGIENDDGSGAVTRVRGDQVDFRLGSIGYLSDCGNFPTFRCWVTGGSADTKVMFNFTTAGGIDYGPFGSVCGDGSTYLDKPFVVYDGNGAWMFTAYVSAGPNDGNLVCHVSQIK